MTMGTKRPIITRFLKDHELCLGMFFNIRFHTYTVPAKFLNGQKLALTRLSFTQDLPIHASFGKVNSIAVCNRICMVLC